MATETAPEQSAQVDPAELTALDELDAATLELISGNRNFNALSEQQRTTLEKLTTPQANAATEEVKPEVEEKPETPILAPEETPVPEVETPEVEQTEEEVTPEAEPEETPTPEATAKGAPSRFRFKDAEDKAVAQIALSKGISLVKAAALYAKLSDPEPTPEPEPEPPEPVAATSPTVKALEAEVATLETQMDGFVDGIHTAESIKVTKELTRKVAQLERAKMEAEQSQAAAQTFEGQRENVMQETVKTFPDMANSNSAQYLIAARLADEAANPKHPNHKAACSMEAPRIFAQMAADMLKIKPAGKTVVPAKVATAKPIAKPGPASGTRQTTPPVANKPEADRLAEKEANVMRTISGGGIDRETTTIFLR